MYKTNRFWKTTPYKKNRNKLDHAKFNLLRIHASFGEKNKFAISFVDKPSTGVKKMTFSISRKFHEFRFFLEKMIPLISTPFYPC